MNLQDLERRLLIGSTLVEGSTLTEDESRQILAGRTVTGHSIAEARELLNYRAATQWLLTQLDESPFLSGDLLLDFHAQLFSGFPGKHGQWKSATNYTFLSNGEKLAYEKPARVPARMRSWIARFNRELHCDPMVESAALYFEFQMIHPFADGNGRIGRVVLAYWLEWKAGLSLSFFAADKLTHLEAMEAAGRGDRQPLVDFFTARTSPCS